MNEQWVLLWSHKQNALHIEPLEKALSVGRALYGADMATDFLALYIGAREDVDNAAQACRSTLERRAIKRSLTFAHQEAA